MHIQYLSICHIVLYNLSIYSISLYIILYCEQLARPITCDGASATRVGQVFTGVGPNNTGVDKGSFSKKLRF